MSDTKITTHKDLDVWKLAMDLAAQVYSSTRTFPKDELYGLVQQIRRSAVSVPSNIAEGAARNSTKEFIQFLYFSLGSLAEMETQFLLAQRLNYINDEIVLDSVVNVRRNLIALISALKKKI
jgi:four helix bundle protein